MAEGYDDPNDPNSDEAKRRALLALMNPGQDQTQPGQDAGVKVDTGTGAAPMPGAPAVTAAMPPQTSAAPTQATPYTPPPPTAPSGPFDSANPQIDFTQFGQGSPQSLLRNAYLQYLGREPDYQGFMNNMKNPDDINFVKNSPEAQAYAAGGGTGYVAPPKPESPAGTTDAVQPPAAAASTGAAGQYLNTSRGFDLGRIDSAKGSLKYDALRVLSNYDPADPASMQKAYAELDKLHPGQYELDKEGNLLLTGTADGYIGARPVDRSSDWENHNQPWSWDWSGYNSAHPGPQGEGANDGGGGGGHTMGGGSAVPAMGGLGNLPVNAQIQAALQALAQGSSDPFLRQALLAQMGQGHG